jgi:hypothetical protein
MAVRFSAPRTACNLLPRNIIYFNVSGAHFLPLTDCNTNYRPVLSSERAPQDEEQSNFPAKEGKK